MLRLFQSSKHRHPSSKLRLLRRLSLQLLRSLLLRLLLLLHLPPKHLLLPKHRRHHRVRSFPAEPLRANLPVTRLARCRVPQHHDPTRNVQIRRARQPRVARLVLLHLVDRPVRRLVAP